MEKYEGNCEKCGIKTTLEIGNPLCRDCYIDWLDDRAVQARRAWDDFIKDKENDW